MNKLFEILGIAAFMFVIGIGAYSFINLGVFNNFDSAMKVFDGLGWFVTMFGLATLFTSYLVVIADTKFFFRFLAIPAWLAFSFALLAALDQFIGYPYPGVPPKAQVLQYRIIIKEDKTKDIEAWMYLSRENRTRSYRFPHTIEQEEKLYGAMKNGKQGGSSLVELDGAEGSNMLDGPEEKKDHNIRHTGLPPKAGDEIAVDTGTTEALSRDNRITIKLPNGNVIEIQPGNSFTITDDGEIELFSDKELPPFDGGSTGRGAGARGYVPDYAYDADEFSGVVPP